MPTNFYKQNGSYYRSDNNAKILTPTDLQTFAKSGGKEIQAPSINPTTADLTAGMNVGSVISNLPSDNSQATQSFAEQSLKQAQDQIKNLQSQLSQYSSKNEQVLNDQLSLEQSKQANLQADTDRTMTDFQNKIEPLRNQVLDFAKTGINTATAQDAKGLVNQRIALANENVSYANLLKNELNKKRAGLASVNSANKIKLLDEYQSKININNAAMSALDGNINLANTILSGASQSLTDNINTQIQFNNMVNAMNQGKSKLIESNIEELKTKLKDVEANKTTIANLFVSNPTIATKAGLSLTDSKEETTKKLTDFYTKNPQYTPENQAWIKSARDKYFDAGITMDDSVETVKSKIQNSALYAKDSYYKGVNITPDTSNATIDDFVAAIGGQESSGDYNAENGRTKAYGKFQILPSNWPSWSSEYASNVLNISTRELPKTPENQEAVAKYKMQQYYNKYGNWEDVASMWYSGKPFSQVVSEGWADKKMGKGNEPSVREYVNSVIGRMGNGTNGLSETAKAVMANPLLINNYTPTRKGQIIDELTNAGVDTSNFSTKPLSDTAIKEAEQYRSALASLDVLETKVKDNLQFVGPITGFAALNPWSEARKDQADIDRVRQTVGKALEGGVLRKEDEEKYKKILATLTDTPETALYKISALKDTLNRDLESYLNAQSASGRYVGDSNKSSINADELRNKYQY